MEQGQRQRPHLRWFASAAKNNPDTALGLVPPPSTTPGVLGRPPTTAASAGARNPVKLAELNEPAQDKDVPLTPRRRLEIIGGRHRFDQGNAMDQSEGQSLPCSFLAWSPMRARGVWNQKSAKVEHPEKFD